MLTTEQPLALKSWLTHLSNGVMTNKNESSSQLKTSSEELQSERLLHSWMQYNENFCANKCSKTNDCNQLHMDDAIPQEFKPRWDNSVRILFPHVFSNDKNTTLTKKHLETSDKWFEKIISLQRDDSARHYHTTWHLLEMFGYLDILCSHSTDDKTSNTYKDDSKAILTMATFFHDVIYNPKSTTNEEDSAELYMQFQNELDMQAENSYQESISESSHDFIYRCILQTKSHSIPPKPLPTPNMTTSQIQIQNKHHNLLQLFMDMDLSVLAKTKTAYDAYAHLIRQEYHFVDRDVYCSKRADILQEFLKCSHIFYSPWMLCDNNGIMEQRARMNLEREIQALRSGVILGENSSD